MVANGSSSNKPPVQGTNAVWQYFEEDDEIWPLQLTDVEDPEQMSVLYPLLNGLPHVVEFYLNDIIFPETLAHQVQYH
jgi:hypothetical protein